MTDSVVVEGYVKFRDGKKWKTRWLVLRKPSPVADCLVLLVYKDKSDKAQGHKERASVTLEDICGLESQWSEGGGYTLAILCLGQAAVLGFDSKEALLAWELRVRYCLGEVHRFSVGVLPGTKLESGPATLHLCNNLLVLARDTPPVIVGQWNLPDLRRYGPVPNGFVFEGGTRCGYWAGVFFLSSAEGEQISFLFDCIVRGVSPSRPPPGLRPVLPEPNASPNDWEERVNHEAQELEKRLSMLSHQSSTASTYSPSVAGDDRSISGSSDTSDTSQSDCSIGSRLAIWSEPATSPASSQTSGQSGAAVATPGEEKLSVGQGGGACLGAKPPASRQLQEIGRQSSSDSGIATGSHSSYSGSFSSYAGSLDIGAGEEFGSLLSLPPHLGVDLNPCCCPPAPGHEYQVPTSLRYLYDTPRSLLREGAGGFREPEGQGAPATGSEGDAAGVPPEEGKSAAAAAPGGGHQHPESCQVCSAHTAGAKTILLICSACGGLKGTPTSHTGGSALPAIPAEESADKCPHGRNSSAERRVVLASSTAADTDALPAQQTDHSSDTQVLKEINGEQATKNKGPEKLAGLFADLLGCPSPAGEPGTRSGRLSLYESMASARHVPQIPPVARGPPRDVSSCRGSVIYENCSKCRRESCCPPPRATPATPYRDRNGTAAEAAQPSPRGLAQARPAGEDHPAQVQLVDRVVQNGDLRCEEVKAKSVTDEDKKRKGAEGRGGGEPAYQVMENRGPDRTAEQEERSKYELMGSCGQQRPQQETEGGVFVFPPDAAAPDRPPPRGDGVTYVNIPVSPASKKQLNYMELELQEATGAGARGSAHLAGQRRSSTKYAQIDITATETAHKVGTQHALGREEGLHALEQRRRGLPQ